jgi:hypothetical protein
MTEAQQRFLKAIAERVNGGQVAEVRLYPTVRAGPIESGVAIVAASGPADLATAPVDEAPIELPKSTDLARLSIHTAHFRHTVKGPDRGKWEFSMVHDADAPIETIESVVRGVARRVGEDGEPELLTGDDFQRALTEPWWTATA